MQIINTYKCNFTCEHCLFSCSPKRKGYLDNYTLNTFLDKYGNNEGFVNYCGGETFLHPDWEYQIKLISNYCDTLRIVTNGSLFVDKRGSTTKLLDRFINVALGITANKKEVMIMISNDSFHRHEFFNKKGYELDIAIEIIHSRIRSISLENILIENDARDIMTQSVADIGRAKKRGVATYDGFCDIDDIISIILDPYGRIYGCCNAAAYIGDICDSSKDVCSRLDKLKEQKSCSKCKYLNGLDSKNIKRQENGKSDKII